MLQILKKKKPIPLTNDGLKGDQSLFEKAKLLYSVEGLKLNIGCGTDCREGFVNIDGSDELPKVDKSSIYPGSHC